MILQFQLFADGARVASGADVIVCLALLWSAGAATLPSSQSEIESWNKRDSGRAPLTSSTQAALLATDATERLTLSHALELAERHSFLLEAAGAQAEGARAAIQSAQAYPNPSIGVIGGQQFARPIQTPGIPGILQHYGASQPIELPSVRSTRLDVAKLGYSASQQGTSAARLAVRSAVKHAFSECLRRREEINQARENLALLSELRRRIQVQVDVGEAARLELTRAEAEIATAENEVRSGQLLYNVARSGLRAAVSAPLSENFQLDGSFPLAGAMPPIADLRLRLADHPVIQQAQLELQRAEAQIRSEQAQRLPQPIFEGEFENQPDLRFYRFGVSLPIPVFDKRRGPIAEAVAASRQARAIFNQRRVEVTAALEAAYGQFEVADQQVRALQSGSLRQANAALAAAQDAYRFGARGILEVLDAQRVLQRVKGDLLNAEFARSSALTDLEELGVLR